jgi:hypothetical protein
MFLRLSLSADLNNAANSVFEDSESPLIVDGCRTSSLEHDANNTNSVPPKISFVFIKL